MDDALQSYKSAQSPIPEKTLTWYLYGAGMENFGKDQKPEEVAVPSFGPDELLVRIDAVGVCFSDIKVVNQGDKHPRLIGRDLTKDPVTLGHEPCVTVVGVGDNLKSKYEIGERFVVQPDVYYQGTSMAFGYVLPGAQTQYQVLTKELLNGDEGAYLLPIKDTTGYAEAALTEAWACVVASYRIDRRSSLKTGGDLWIVGSPEDDGNYKLDMEIESGTVYATDVNHPLISELKKAADAGKFDLVETPQWVDLDLAAFAEEHGMFDDVIVLGNDADVIEAAVSFMGKGATLTLLAREPISRPVKVDVGKIHYHDFAFLGTTERSIASAFKSVRNPSSLRPGGAAWFIGGAGPMGKMHVQLAMESKNGPSRVLVTDVGAERLQAAMDQFTPIGERKGVEFQAVNPADMTTEEFAQFVSEFTDGKGFDDIVVMAPIALVVAGAIPHLGEEGLLNIFAGIPIGTIGELDLTNVYMKNIRLVGASGSKLSDMKATLDATESGQLSTATALAAIGGIEASWDGLSAVKGQKFTGKVVIFPQIHNLDLVAVADLKEKYPNVYAKMADGKYWTNEAETELLNTMLK